MTARFQAACRPFGQSVSRTSGHSELYICHSIVVVKNGLTTEGHTTEGHITEGHTSEGHTSEGHTTEGHTR